MARCKLCIQSRFFNTPSNNFIRGSIIITLPFTYFNLPNSFFNRILKTQNVISNLKFRIQVWFRLRFIFKISNTKKRLTYVDFTLNFSRSSINSTTRFVFTKENDQIARHPFWRVVVVVLLVVMVAAVADAVDSVFQLFFLLLRVRLLVQRHNICLCRNKSGNSRVRKLSYMCSVCCCKCGVNHEEDKLYRNENQKKKKQKHGTTIQFLIDILFIHRLLSYISCRDISPLSTSTFLIFKI